jgi:hypothetical protein
LWQSNAVQIKNAFESVDESQWEVVTFGCSFVGWREYMSVQIHDESGEYTEAFTTLFDLYLQIEQYPILSDDHYSELESEATHENLIQAIQFWSNPVDSRDLELPESGELSDHAYTVESDLNQHNPNALESVDDSGAWPSDSVLFESFKRLGWLEVIPRQYRAYVLHEGLCGGYLPSRVEYYTNKRDLFAGMAQTARDLRDDSYQVVGNRESGYEYKHDSQDWYPYQVTWNYETFDSRESRDQFIVENEL